MNNVHYKKRVSLHDNIWEETFLNVSGDQTYSPHLLQLYVYSHGKIPAGKSYLSTSSLDNKFAFAISNCECHVLSDTFSQRVISAGEVLCEHPDNGINYRRDNHTNRESPFAYIIIHRNIHIESMFRLDQTRTIKCQDLKVIWAIMEDIRKLVSKPDGCDAGTLSTKLFEFLTRLYIDAAIPSYSSSNYANLFTLVKTNPNNYPSLKKLQELFGVSGKTLNKLFLENTNMTPMACVINHRLRNSCWMLYQTNMSIEEIAHKCGYKNPHLYSRQFRALFGISPLKYRQNGQLVPPPA